MNTTTRYILLLLIAMICMPMNAQRNFNPQRFRADLHKFVVAEANLTDAEARTLLPLYDEMNQQKRALHKKMRGLRHQKATGAAASRRIIVECDNLEIKMKQIEKSYHQKMLRKASPQKVLSFIRAADRFHRKAFRRAAHRR